MTSVKRLWNTLFGKPSADKKKGKKDKEASPVYPESSSIAEGSSRRPLETLQSSWISEPDEDSKPTYVLNVSMVDSSQTNVSQGADVTTQRLFSRGTQSTNASVQVPARFHTTTQSWASHRSSNIPVGPATPPLGGSTEALRSNRSPKGSRHGSMPDNAAAAFDSLNLSELLHADYETLSSMAAEGPHGQQSARSTQSEMISAAGPGSSSAATTAAGGAAAHAQGFPLKSRSNRVCAITEEASDAAVAGTSGSHSLAASSHHQHHMLTADRTAAALAPSTPGGSSKAAASQAATPSSTPAVAPSTPDQPPGHTHKLRYVEQWLAEAEGGAAASPRKPDGAEGLASEPEGRANGHVVREGLRAGSGSRNMLGSPPPTAPADTNPASSSRPGGASPERRPPATAPPSQQQQQQQQQQQPPQQQPHTPPAWYTGSRSAWLQDDLTTTPANPRQPSQQPAADPTVQPRSAPSPPKLTAVQPAVQQGHHGPVDIGAPRDGVTETAPQSPATPQATTMAHSYTAPQAQPMKHSYTAAAGQALPTHPASKLGPQAATPRAATPPATEEHSPSALSTQLEDNPAQASERAGQAGREDSRRSSGRHGSVKTITVAKHCPKDIIATSWSIHDYDILKKCYEGHLSVVCHVRHKVSGRQLAMKIYKRSRLHEMERYQLAREICMHVRITHPSIIKLYAAWKDPSYVYLAMELAPKGNLFDYLVSRGGKLPEAEAARTVLQPLLSSLVYIHNLNFIHRDIKLENILLGEDLGMKLADFGLAIDHNYEVANTRLGTFGYFAPEVLDCPLKQSPFDYKDQTQLGYNSKVDVWSLGVLCFELLTGKGPFSASTAAKIITAIRNRVVQFPDSLSPEARDFMELALQRNPEKRATAKQLLTHPWITQHCPEAVALPPGLATTSLNQATREEPVDVPGAVL